MITSSDQLFTSLPLPNDPRETNLVLNGDVITVETIAAYLNRVKNEDRYLGLEVIVCKPAGTYSIQSFMTNASLGNLSFDRYEFVDISDLGLVLTYTNISIVDNLVSGGTNKALSAEQGVILKDLIENTSFLNLSDTPNSYEFKSNSIPVVDLTEDKLVFIPRTFVHDQGIPSQVWTVTHVLNKFPSVLVKASSGDAVEGAVNYIDENHITITFNSAFSGKAILN